MALLKPDKTTTINGVKVNEFLLTKHNPNKISMPTTTMDYAGVTIHNTEDLDNVHDDAEQYTRATYNGNMRDVRVHYYVDDLGAWQNLPLNRSGWHATDGNGKGNRTTVAIECIMKGSTGTENVKAEDNCAKLAAWLLFSKGLGIDKLYTHTHWLNVKEGKKGNVDTLNTAKNNYKMCPAFILPHWSTFKGKVQGYINQLKNPNTVTTTVSKPATTKPTVAITYKAKTAVKLNKTSLYMSSMATKASAVKTGTYYIYDAKVTNNRIRITTTVQNCGKAGKVTGWVDVSNIKVQSTSTTNNVEYFKKYTGKSTSIVQALNSIGVTSSYLYRTKIAKANKISLYVGTASQNTKMLNLLKQGKLIKP